MKYYKLISKKSYLSLDLLSHWLHLLSDNSLWSDDFAHFLDDGSGHGVDSHMGLVLGLGLLEGTRRGNMDVLDVHLSGHGFVSQVDGARLRLNVDVGGRSEASALGWDVLHLLASVDGKGTWGAIVTAESSSQTSAETSTESTSQSSSEATAITTVSGLHRDGKESRQNNDLKITKQNVKLCF